VSQREWTAVTKRKPCPACEGTDWCAWGHSGLLKCERQDSAPTGMVLVSKKDGGGIFRYIDERPAPPKPPRRSCKKPVAAFDGEKEQVKFLAALTQEKLADLAATLGVTDASLAAIGCGWATKADLERLGAWGKDWTTRPHGAFTFPERDGEGRIVGFSLRPETGAKGAFSGDCGAHRGVVVPHNLAGLPDPVLVVEGASDVAACLTMGLKAVGRPSNASGAEDVAGLVSGRKVVVLGENDCKDHGDWPGREGAAGVASSLSELWGRPVPWRMPPKGAKDARDWLNQRVPEGLDLGDREATEQAGREWMGSLRGLSDSIPPPREKGCARNEWAPVPLSELGSSEPPDWVWEGFVARGHSTLFCGLWKAGKTTLVGWLVHDLEHGGGLSDARGFRTLIISEENSTFWKDRRDKHGLGDATHIIPRPFKARATFPEWAAFVEHVVGLVETGGYGLVVFDSLPSLWPVTDENNASEVLTALMPLGSITDLGAALLLVTHPKKGDASEAQAIRGSGALPGWVDVIVEMRRAQHTDPGNTLREMTTYSRFDESPPKAVYELTDDGYRHLGDRAMATKDHRLRLIEGILAAADGDLSPEQVREQWSEQAKPAQSTVGKDLAAGYEAGRWQRSGSGARGSPYLYGIPAGFDSRAPTPLGGRKETEWGDEPHEEVA